LQKKIKLWGKSKSDNFQEATESNFIFDFGIFFDDPTYFLTYYSGLFFKLVISKRNEKLEKAVHGSTGALKKYNYSLADA